MIYNPFPRNHETPMRANLCARSRAPRVIGIVQRIDTNAPKRKILKDGKRRIIFK